MSVCCDVAETILGILIHHHPDTKLLESVRIFSVIQKKISWSGELPHFWSKIATNITRSAKSSHISISQMFQPLGRIVEIIVIPEHVNDLERIFLCILCHYSET